jgi:hypothetical protein
MSQSVDLEQLVFTLKADISQSKKAMAEAVLDVDRRTKQIEKTVSKPVKTTWLSDFRQQMMAGTAGAGQFGAALGVLGGIGLVAAGGLAAAGVALRVVRDAMDMADEIADTSAKLQVGVETLQEYRFAMIKAGGATADADAALGSFTKKLGEARLGSKEALGWFARLGFSAEDLKSFASVEDALGAVTDRISEVGSAAERAAVAEKMGLEKFIPVINQGEGALANLREEARRVGYVLSEDVVKELSAAKDQADVLAQIINAQLATAFADLAPVLISTLQLISDITGEVGKLIKRIQDWQATAASISSNTPKPVRELQRNLMAWHPLGRGLLNLQGINPDTGDLALPTGGRRVTDGAAIDRMESAPPETGGRRLINPPAPGRTGRVRAKTGPSPEEIAHQRMLLDLTYRIEEAKAKGDDSRAKALQDEMEMWREIASLMSSGKYNEQQAKDIALSHLMDKRQAERDRAATTAVNVDANPSISNAALDQFNDNWNAMAEEHKAQYRDLISGAFDAARYGGVDGLLDYFAQQLGNKATDALVEAITNAAIAAEGTSGGSGGGFNWGTIVGAISKIFTPRASGGPVRKGMPYMVGEKGPEPFFPDTDGTIVPNGVRVGMPSIQMPVARGGGTHVTQNIYADQSIMTPDIFRRIHDVGMMAAQFGATSGAAQGSAAAGRASARQQSRRIPR